MSIRSFWLLIIKTIGIWIVIRGIISLPEIVINFLVAYNAPYSTSEVIFFQVLFLIVPILFYLLVLRFLILKTQSIIDLLKLERGFEETRIDITLPYNKVLRIIIILIGGIIFITAIPNLFENLYSFITEDRPFNESPMATSLIVGIVQSIIGFLIMTNSDIVQRYINKKSGEAESKQLDKEEF
ncbi:MAG: hypothetical protein K0S23_266 [Fluviicola sp.]|jgi:hypothetical protein|uniref:hypothetical protein n=1 Tax=Fluviicola sp. TaxID=1917219 RepID=UPI002639554C|nr:hypothetical protein [Fluviicola sp.]MDF3025959.1 hypothetical protein [Fluviicola sp.]